MAHELLDDLLARERFDAFADYALAFGGLVLADRLGVPRSDAGRLMGWALDLVAFFNDVEITAAGAERMARAAAELTRYAHALLAAGGEGARAGAPAHDGLLGQAAAAAVRAGQELGDEAVGNVALPFLTGQVAVAQLVANAVWLLLAHDDQRARLAAQPGLLPGAVAETLRCLPPAALAPRIALEPVDVDGRRIETGQVVQLDLKAANRDPERFPRPERFDIARRQAGALGFGHGPHACVAAGLGRMQATVALHALLERAPGLAPDPERDVVWSPLAGVDGPEALGVRPTAARAARRAR
jgi:cytochrome P450